MVSGIILIAGVSGVGKTTLCQRLVAAESGIHHLIASSFVDRQHASDQVALAARISAAAQALCGACLVDGHLIVGGNKVPPEAVVGLAPKAIIMVTDRPGNIITRRALDTSRSRPAITEADVHHAQEAEFDWARELALTISVPFTTVNSQDSDGFRAEVLHRLGSG